MRRGWVDRVLVGAALLLVAGVAAQAIVSWLGGRDVPTRSSPATSTAAGPPGFAIAEAEVTPLQDSYTIVPLHGSPETEFLATCRFSRFRIDVRPGPSLRVRYSGPPCAAPAFDLDALVRDPVGRAARRVPAVGPVNRLALEIRHFAGRDGAVVRLADGLLRCRSGRPDGLRAVEHGAVVRGTVPCRAQR